MKRINIKILYNKENIVKNCSEAMCASILRNSNWRTRFFTDFSLKDSGHFAEIKTENENENRIFTKFWHSGSVKFLTGLRETDASMHR